MTSLADVLAYRRVARRVTAASVRQVRDVLAVTNRLAPLEQRNALLVAVPRIVDGGASVMGDFAATWAEDLFSAAGQRFTPAGVALPAEAAVVASVKWAVAPMFGLGAGTVRDNLVGVVSRYVLDAGRAAVADSRGRVRYQRIASPGCCDWCAMLASQGSVYYDEATGDAGSHDNDQCVVAPIFSGDRWAQSVADRFMDRYTGQVSREEDAALPL